MGKTISYFDEPADFSLVQGGPLFQFFMRLRLQKPPTDLVARRIVAILIVAWLPLLVLSAISGQAIGGPGVAFFQDLGAQVRFLICVPVLLAAEVIVHRRIRPIVQQFVDRDVIAPDDQPQFHSIIASAMRLRNSPLAEAILFVMAIAIGHWAGRRYLTTQSATWYSSSVDGQSKLTVAGYWYTFVSLTIFRFLLVRWYFRFFVWTRFLWQISRRIPLRTNALHPDRAAGLGFLSGSVFAFEPVLIAHTVTLAGFLGDRILNEGATLPQFYVEIATWVLFLMMLVLTPLFFFTPHLAEAKRTGLREFGIVASRYVTDFRRKWIDGHVAKDEALIGSADIQSLADLSNSFETVRNSSILPFGRTTVLPLMISLLLPMAPLILTMVPLHQLIEGALGLFL